MSAIPLPGDKPKSLVLFLGGALIGLFVFLPIAVVGLSYEKVAMFLTGTAGVAVSWLLAAFMGFLFTAGLSAGRYKEMHALPWHQQVW